MPTWLSITWENDRLMLLAARIHNGSATFERAAVLKSAAPDGDDAKKSQPSLKKQLEKYIQDNRLAKAETVVLLSRAEVEVRPMVFPPVPVEELPDLVKFQASKEFNGYDGSAPLDFFITNKLENVSRSTLFPAVRASGKQKEAATSGGAPKHLLASTIRSDTFRKIRQFCDDLNLNLRRIVLRPCEAAYLLRQRKEFNPDRTVLLVELDTMETSQAVLFQGEPVFMRAPKISCPEDVGAADFAARLIAELKRTRIAVRNEIQGVTVDEVVLCGVGRGFDALARQVSVGMDIPVKTFDPWEKLSKSGELKNPQFDAPERFAALIGATLQAGKGEPGAIDFCNPKKRPEPVGHRQLITGVLAACFLLLVCVIAYGFYSRTTLADEVKKLSNRKTALDKTAKDVAVDRTQLKAVDDWAADDVNWFDQLAWLSRSAPPAQDMILNKLAMSANRGGSMALETLVRDASIASPMEERFRDAKHDVKTGEKGEFKGNLQYGFRSNLSVFLSQTAAAMAPVETPTEPAPVEPTPEEQAPSAPESDEAEAETAKGGTP